MKNYLKEYHVTLKTIGPVFVGSGKELSKKEYLFLDDLKSTNNRSRFYYGNQGQRLSKLGILDINGFYEHIIRRGRGKQFEEFLLTDSRRTDFKQWIESNGIRESEVLPYLRYELDCSESIIQRRADVHIMECIKDPYGKPYIPGSSLKGMLRTILLSERIMHDTERFVIQKEGLSRASVQHQYNRKAYLNNENRQVEERAFHTLNREVKKSQDAVNDELSGFIVSDSAPLDMKDVVLCQKIEGHTDGTEKRLNLFRECIRPGCEIHFTITVDETRCKIDESSLIRAIQDFDESYYNNFLKAFDEDRLQGNVVFLGGGCGYLSKTYIYPMFGKHEGMKIAQRVFQNTLSGKAIKEHKHNQDLEFGASPHILKYTRYKGRRLQFGECVLSIET